MYGILVDCLRVWDLSAMDCMRVWDLSGLRACMHGNLVDCVYGNLVDCVCMGS